MVCFMVDVKCPECGKERVLYTDPDEPEDDEKTRCFLSH